MTLPERDAPFWVFAYGSLMWRPGFPHSDACAAVLHGYHRALCVYSTRYRGTPECPGLVLGLDRGGSCRGRVMRVSGEDSRNVIAYLKEREMVNRVYTPRILAARLDDGRRVPVYAFTVRRDHAHYAGKLPLERAADVVRLGHGPGGSSLDYLENTVAHLDQLGITDGPLHRILELAKGRGDGERRRDAHPSSW